MMKYEENGFIGRQKKKCVITGIMGVLAMLLLASCGQKKIIEGEKSEIGFVAGKTGAFDSADTAIVVEMNREDKTVTLKNMDVKRQYTLSYDGTTFFYDKYGTVISDAQLKKGEIVDVTFLKERKRLNSLQLSKEAWSHRNIDDYKLDEENFRAEVGSTVYVYSEDTVVVADGKQGDLIDLNPVDILTFRGMGSEIYSIVVEKGHGYVRLKNEEYFYDGWIEIGNKIIKKVTENMMLTVPVGNHQVIISNKGTSGVKQIEVRKDMELELDVGDLKGEDPKYGNVIFTVTPQEASLYLDGSKMDHSQPVRLEYGIHQMIVMAEGYKTVSQYLKVGQASAGIEVTMEAKETKEEKESVSDNNVSGNNTSNGTENLVESGTNKGNTENNGTNNVGTTNPPVTSALTYYVTIDVPVGVEVYLNGNYIGITPCSFKKEPGIHTLTLRKAGYTTKSYTIWVDNEEKNVSYSFLELVKTE